MYGISNYDTNKIALPDEALKKLMMDTLYICIEYRNVAAHGVGDTIINVIVL